MATDLSLKGNDMINFIKRVGRLTDGNYVADGARNSAWVVLVSSATLLVFAWAYESLSLAMFAIGFWFLSLFFRATFRAHEI